MGFFGLGKLIKCLEKMWGVKNSGTKVNEQTHIQSLTLHEMVQPYSHLQSDGTEEGNELSAHVLLNSKDEHRIASSTEVFHTQQ